MTTHSLIALMALVILASCGGSGGGGGGSNNSGKSGRQEMVAATPGTYYTVLRPVNFHSNGFIPYGMATFTMKDDLLNVEISLDDDQAVPHRQSLHIGTRCPTMADDTNGDGFVDQDEAQRVVGPIVMPLDSDISSQMAGIDGHPRGPAMTYKKSALISKINADLWGRDEDPSDLVTKLAPNKGIGFEKRVVLVHGTSFQSSFPTSLAHYKNEPAHHSLPVVCGVLEKIQ